MKIYHFLCFLGVIATTFLGWIYYHPHEISPDVVEMPKFEDDTSRINVNIIGEYEIFQSGRFLVDQKRGYIYISSVSGYLQAADLNTRKVETVLKPRSFQENSITDREIICQNRITWYANLESCGVIEGLTIDSKGRLLIANSYHGIFRYDLETKELENILSHHNVDTVMEGYDGKLYFTVSSQNEDYGFHNRAYAFFDTSSFSGLYSLDQTGKVVRLASFPSLVIGASISEDRKNIFICETSRRRVRRFDIEKTSASVLLENLPLYPTHVELSEGRFLISGSEISETVENVFFKSPQYLMYITKLPFLFHYFYLARTVTRQRGMFVTVEEKDLKDMRVYVESTGELGLMNQVSRFRNKNGEKLYLSGSFFENNIKILKIEEDLTK